MPDGYVLKINGSVADLEDGEYAFKEAGDYSVELVGPDGTSTAITVTMSDGASPSFPQILDGSTYPAGQGISVPQGWTLTVNGQPCGDGSYSFKEDGEYEITVTDADGNAYTKHITIQHMHEYSSEVTKEPECTKDGTLTFTCQVCGRSYTQAILHTGHDYTEWGTVDEATCTEKGLKRRTCKSCGNVDEEELNALGHDKADAFTVDSEATCTEAGSKSRHCTRCDEKLDVTELPALGHNAADEFTTDKAATCTAAGSKSRHCTRCSEKLDITEIPALGHSFGEWKVTKAATCMETGTSERTCARCGQKEGRTDAKLTTHVYSATYTTDTAATCTTAGSKSRHCTVSGCTAKTDVTAIPASGHSYGSWVTVTRETCTSAGSRKHTCNKCGNVATETVAALGHDYASTYTTDKAATCTAAGSKSRHCTRCSAKTDVTSIAALGHSYGSWTTTSAATCTAAGSKKHTCSRCSHAETQAIPALGHNYSSTYTIDKAATCTAAGSKSRHCTRCSATTDNTAISATGHSYGAWTTASNATCTTDGSERRTCTKCSNVETKVIQALGHIFSRHGSDEHPCASHYGCAVCSKKLSANLGTVAGSTGSKASLGTDHIYYTSRDLTITSDTKCENLGGSKSVRGTIKVDLSILPAWERAYYRNPFVSITIYENGSAYKTIECGGTLGSDNILSINYSESVELWSYNTYTFKVNIQNSTY